MRIEHWRYAIPLWLRGLFHRGDVEHELDDEIRDHIEQQTRANIAAGMSEADARRSAFISFGGVERVKEESRDTRRLDLIESVARMRFAMRSLARARTFTAASVLTIALGVGAGSTMYTLIHDVLLRPLPYPESDRLVDLWHSFPGLGMKLVPQAPGTYDSYRREATQLEAIASHTGTISVSYGDPADGAPRVTLSSVTPSLFPMLRVRPLLGRLFADNDVPTDQRSDFMIVSERFWRIRLASNPRVLGTRLRVGDADRTIIGVLPASFHFPSAEVDVWFPFEIRPGPYLGSFGFFAMGRMRPGATVDGVQHELQQILMRVPERFPEIHAGESTRQALAQTKATTVVISTRDDLVGGFAHVLSLLGAVVVTLVAVALSNVGSLGLARVQSRRREFAVRTTLGASTARILGAVVTEAGMIAITGGLIGLGVAILGIRLLRDTGSLEFVNPLQGNGNRVVIPRLDEIHVDPSLVAAATVLTMLFWVVATAAGSWRLISSDLSRSLREGGRVGTTGRAYHRLRTVFVGAEVALSLVLLSGAGVLAKSLMRLMDVDTGFDPTNVVSVDIAPPLDVRTPAQIARFYRGLLARVGQNPSVVSVAIATKLPFLSGPTTRPIWVEDSPPAVGMLPRIFPLVDASPGYFATMKIPLLAGRTWNDANVIRGANEAVVGRGFAMRYWKDSTGNRALGRRFRPYADGPWYTVVGVVADVRDTALTSSRSAILYLPEEPSVDTVVGTRPSRGMSVVMRVHGDPNKVAESVERDLRLWSPGMIVFEPKLMSDVVSAAGSTARFVLLLLGIGATCTLVLGIIGLYGVIAYLVSLRTREIGVRIALGLIPGRAAGMILKQGGGIIAVGAAAGVAVFLGFATLLRTLVFGADTEDVMSIVAATLIVTVVAAVAIWLPARRAARIDPAEALRAD